MRQASLLVGLNNPSSILDVALFAEAFYPRVSMKWDMDAGACIASACIAGDVFRKLGYEARPLPVIVEVANEDLVRRHAAGEDVRYTHLVIGDPSDVEEEGRWKGHIATSVHHPERNETFILDASLRQAQRDYLPHVSDLLVLPVAPHRDHFGARPADILIGGCAHESSTTRISYFLLTGPERETWRTSPDAQPARRRMTVKRIADQIIKRRRKVLAAETIDEMAPHLSEIRGVEGWVFAARKDAEPEAQLVP